MIQLVLEESKQGQSLLVVTLFVGEDVSKSPLLCVKVEDDVDIADLLKFDLGEQAVQVDLAEVNLADCWGTCTFLHRLLRIDNVYDRIEADELIDLLKHHLRCLVTADVPYAHNLGTGAVTASDLLKLEASGRVCKPLLLLENEFVEQSSFA